MVTINAANEKTGASNTILQGQGVGTASDFSTATYPATTTSQQILYSTAANTVGQLTTANSSLPATNSAGTLAMRALSVNIQVFTSTGTYTPTTGMLYCIIEVVGSGGAGGSTATAAAASLSSGGGGGGGSYARKFASAATIGASQAVTIGAGGTAGSSGNNPGNAGADCSLGAICVGKGGSGGGGSSGSDRGSSGSGGVVGTGDFTFTGIDGNSGYFYTAASASIGVGGEGGGTFFGSGSITFSSLGTGPAGKLYGSGGAGGNSVNAGGAAVGGVGAKGLVVVTEYIIA